MRGRLVQQAAKRRSRTDLKDVIFRLEKNLNDLPTHETIVDIAHGPEKMRAGGGTEAGRGIGCGIVVATAMAAGIEAETETLVVDEGEIAA